MIAERKRPFTPETLAERWQCSTGVIYRMLSSGQLPGFKIGKLWRIRAEDVEEFESRVTMPNNAGWGS